MRTISKILALAVIVLVPAVAGAERNDYRHSGRGGWVDHYRPSSPGGWYERRGWYERPDYSQSGYRREPWHIREHRAGRDIEWRIRDGVRRGDLSPREVRELEQQRRDLRREEARYWSDGRLSSGERRDLRQDYQGLRRDLNHELNDGERREWRRGRLR